ncbi:MAG: hypothetical protein HQ581_05885 [Planctomycetes bacterium]|nr:hypothetical protein [Planctomycetota bacterium]
MNTAVSPVAATSIQVESPAPATRAGIARNPWMGLAGGVLLGLLGLAAVVLFERRVAGALYTPLSGPAMAAVGMLLAVTSAAARTLLRAVRSQSTTPHRRWLAWLPTAPLLLAGLALTLPGGSTGGWIALWSILAAGELGGWWVARRVAGQAKTAPCRPATQVPRGDVSESSRSAVVESAAEASPSDASAATFATEIGDANSTEIPEENVVQRFTRRLDASGGEILQGWIRAPFVAGQRTTNVHVAFCPPFRRSPQLSVEQCEGPEARIKQAQILPHGARLDLKLTRATEEATRVTLAIRAESEAL